MAVSIDELEELGRLKTGDDKTFRGIAVTVGGLQQDLTAPGWSVRVQLRPALESDTVVTPTIDVDELANSRVVCSLTRTQSATMVDRSSEIGHTWVGDLEVTGTESRQSSKTFIVYVEADVTQ